MAVAATPETRAQPELSAIGQVVAVHGPVVDIGCDRLPPLHRALFATVHGDRVPLEVFQHLPRPILEHLSTMSLPRNPPDSHRIRSERLCW